MNKSLNTRAWLKVNHDSLVDMGIVNTLNRATTYAQRWTCTVDT